jgi:hypothetical protein
MNWWHYVQVVMDGKHVLTTHFVQRFALLAKFDLGLAVHFTTKFLLNR